jgi:hypothetical protein
MKKHLLLCFTFIIGQVFSQVSDKKIKVYLLGTFHFSQTDSSYQVMDEKHQKSINELNDIIVGLNPNKIFIERMPDFEKENKMDSLYTAYFNREKETNNPNEIWQVAFKTAKRLGHKKLYQCDHPGNYGSLYAEIEEYAKEHNQMNILEYDAKELLNQKQIPKQGFLMQSMTLLDFIKWLNNEVQSTAHAHYVNVFPQIGHTDVYDYKKNYLLGTEIDS